MLQTRQGSDKDSREQQNHRQLPVRPGHNQRIFSGPARRRLPLLLSLHRRQSVAGGLQHPSVQARMQAAQPEPDIRCGDRHDPQGTAEQDLPDRCPGKHLPDHAVRSSAPGGRAGLGNTFPAIPVGTAGGPQNDGKQAKGSDRQTVRPLMVRKRQGDSVQKGSEAAGRRSQHHQDNPQLQICGTGVQHVPGGGDGRQPVVHRPACAARKASV